MKKIIKRNKLKLMSFFMALVMVLTNVLPLSSVIVYAENTTKDSIGSINKEDDGTNVGVDITQGQETTYSDELTNESQENTLVYVSQASTFNVIIPKVVILDGETKNASYVVGVSGNIGGMENIEVVPEDSFLMKQQGKNDITALVSQDKTSWSYDEFETKGNGSIEANDMTAGMWNGSFVFNIKLNASNNEQPTTPETPLSLSLETNDLAIGTGEQAQVNAFYDNKDVTNLVTWESDNENIVVENGLIETKASAKVGDTATITVSANENELNETLVSSLIDTLTFSKVVYAETGDVSIEFIVTIVDIEYSIDSISLHSGESQEITAKIIPETINDTVTWSSTAVSGINLIKNGNNLTIKVADDMETGKTYYIIATYGNYSKTLAIDIISEQPQLEAGLYDANGVMLCTWEESGIDVETDYTSSTCKTAITSPYYNLTNKYKTATKIVLPNTITKIGQNAFNYCKTLQEIELPNSLETIDHWSFANTGLLNIEIPNSVTIIGSAAFTGSKNLTNVKLSENITKIQHTTFAYCNNLETINIPQKVLDIEYNAFQDTKWLTNKLEENPLVITETGLLINGTNCTGDIIIPNNVTRICSNAFKLCSSNITSVQIPNSVTSIGEYAFAYCKNLTTIEIPNSVTNIENYAFYYCTSLTTVTTSGDIGEYAFNGCSKLSNVTINNVSTIGKYVFSSCPISNLKISNGIKIIKKGAFNNCTKITNIDVPESATTIEENAFYNVPHITYNGTATGSPWGAKSIN